MPKRLVIAAKSNSLMRNTDCSIDADGDKEDDNQTD